MRTLCSQTARDLTDADDLHVGQAAFVRFEALQDRARESFEGKVTRISADSFVDERTGESYYSVEVTVPPEEFDRVEQGRGQNLVFRPGMPVQLSIPLRARTALQYAVEPLTGTLSRSLSEQ